MRAISTVALLACAGLVAAVDTGWNGRAAGTCTSTGDTHVWNFNNQYYDVMWPGTYVFAKSNDGFFESQVKQRRWTQNLDRITVIKDAAVRCGHDILEMRVTGGRPEPGTPSVKMLFNGKELALREGESRDLVHYPDKRPPGRAGIMRVTMVQAHSGPFKYRRAVLHRVRYREAYRRYRHKEHVRRMLRWLFRRHWRSRWMWHWVWHWRWHYRWRWRWVTTYTWHYRDPVHRWRVECNKQASLDSPGTFVFEHLVNIRQSSNSAFANAMVTVDPNVYSDGTMTGYCGFTPAEMDNAFSANNCFALKFMSNVCHRLITVDQANSLFQDPAWHDKRLEALKADDQAKMAKFREECEKELHKLVPEKWLKKQPADLQDETGGFVKACAFDGYNGMVYDTDSFDDLVCNLVDDRVEALRRQMASAYQGLRCMFTYDNALHYDGKVNVRAATEYYWERVDELRTQIENFCTGPCKCEATEKAEDSPNDKACEDLPAEMKEELQIRFGRKDLPEGKDLDGLYSVPGDDDGSSGAKSSSGDSSSGTPTHAASFREKEVLLMRREVQRDTRKHRGEYLRELHEKLARGDVNDDDTVILDDK